MSKEITEHQNIHPEVAEHMISKLKKGDTIAFGFAYYGGPTDEIIVAPITEAYNEGKLFLCHFSYGYKALFEQVKLEEIIAIGNKDTGESLIKGWTGRYDLVNSQHHLVERYVTGRG